MKRKNISNNLMDSNLLQKTFPRKGVFHRKPTSMLPTLPSTPLPTVKRQCDDQLITNRYHLIIIIKTTTIYLLQVVSDMSITNNTSVNYCCVVIRSLVLSKLWRIWLKSTTQWRQLEMKGIATMCSEYLFFDVTTTTMR